ncbi:MAG: META domain-containing protein [Chitinophagaceae bacterium]|nr:MAG: META domain-containing protein [Chitinophagaceae bacterium]
MNKILIACLIVAGVGLAACHNAAKSQTDRPKASLTNTYWKLSMANDRPVVTPDNSREIHIKFRNEGSTLLGFAGCNGLGGNYVLSGENGIRITAITTKMYCDRMETENFLTNAITKADNYRVTGEKLSLFQGRKLLATFEAVYL